MISCRIIFIVSSYLELEKNNCSKKKEKTEKKKTCKFVQNESPGRVFWLTQFLLCGFLPVRLRWVTGACQHCASKYASRMRTWELQPGCSTQQRVDCFFQQKWPMPWLNSFTVATTTTTTAQTINNTNKQQQKQHKQPTTNSHSTSTMFVMFSISRSLLLVLRFLSFTNSAKIVIVFSTACVIELPHWRRVNLQIGNGSLRPTPNSAGFSPKIQIAKWQMFRDVFSVTWNGHPCLEGLWLVWCILETHFLVGEKTWKNNNTFLSQVVMKFVMYHGEKK